MFQLKKRGIFMCGTQIIKQIFGQNLKNLFLFMRIRIIHYWLCWTIQKTTNSQEHTHLMGKQLKNSSSYRILIFKQSKPKNSFS